MIIEENHCEKDFQKSRQAQDMAMRTFRSHVRENISIDSHLLNTYILLALVTDESRNLVNTSSSIINVLSIANFALHTDL